MLCCILHCSLNDRSGFHYVMAAPISTTVRADDDRLTYMNKGQFYEVTLAWDPALAAAASSLAKGAPKGPENQKQKPFSSAAAAADSEEDEEGDEADIEAYETIVGARPDQMCQSVLIVTLRDLLSVNEQLAAWQFWHSRQPTGPPSATSSSASNSRVIDFGTRLLNASAHCTL